MATFRVPSLSLTEEVIPKRTIAYFTRRLRHHLHELVTNEFYSLAADEKITPGRLAKRLDKDPAQITRWLGAPGNWTLDTVAQLMVGVAVDPRFILKPLREKPQRSRVIAAQVDSTGTLRSTAAFDESGTDASLFGATSPDPTDTASDEAHG